MQSGGAGVLGIQIRWLYELSGQVTWVQSGREGLVFW
jgi:hypothetical protein